MYMCTLYILHVYYFILSVNIVTGPPTNEIHHAHAKHSQLTKFWSKTP